MPVSARDTRAAPAAPSIQGEVAFAKPHTYVHAFQPGEGAMHPIISVRGISKTYAGGVTAIERVDLDVERGEILALLGPNGAGKTTLISIICGLVTASAGSVSIGGHDIVTDYRRARSMVGLVPQELTVPPFETVWATITFSRGLFGRRPDRGYLEGVLRDLTLLDKKDSQIMALSGGMKRRVLIAKALAHQPDVLFLDEPTAGVDVELRKDMWALVRRLRAGGTTIILTTHYIAEAEEMADRIGIISRGRLMLIEEKGTLMRKLGRKQLRLDLATPLAALPPGLGNRNIALARNGNELVYTYDEAGRDGIGRLLGELGAAGIGFKDLETRESSLEDIFVDLVREGQ
jgi:ABC-2 type transport system ATP-binding protein